MKQIDKIEKEKSTLKHELQSATVAVQHSRTELAEKQHECRQLYRALSDEEKKFTNTKKKVDGVMNEKDQIGAEIVKRNEEIEMLTDKRDLTLRALDQGMNYNCLHFSLIFSSDLNIVVLCIFLPQLN